MRLKPEATATSGPRTGQLDDQLDGAPDRAL